MLKNRFYNSIVAAAALLAIPANPGDAAACGCLSPPIPQPDAVNFAVNQQSEQIIFEVDEGMISQHVLIRYAGAAEKFAWLLPVPSVPEITLSYSSIFGLVDEGTQPIVELEPQSLCPRQQYQCRTHAPCREPGDGEDDFGWQGADAGVAFSPETGEPPAVTVFAREVVGDYDTVVLGAGNAQLIIDWLQANQFLVSDALVPFMQPYLDAKQLFVASKLVPGADVKQMRPLKLRYEGDVPSIPLRLTPVAAEPHLTVTAFIYGNKEFEPMAQKVTTIPEEYFGASAKGRSNYPMALARAVDDAGGSAFVREYVGKPPVFTDTTGCCDGTFDNGFFTPDAGSSAGQIRDVCGIGSDGQCQCPSAGFDAEDCAADEDAAGAVLLAEQLSTKYSTLSRLTTRVSPEEMTFDPAFKAKTTKTQNMRLRATATTLELDGCEDRVVPSDEQRWISARDVRACDAAYCGRGECVGTSVGAACECDKGFVARSFVDLDGAVSITCVPLTPPKNAGGADLPSPCDGKKLEHGACVEAGGFAAAVCDAGYAAAIEGPTIGGVPSAPGCVKIHARSGGPGGTNSTLSLKGLRVCSPKPPLCSADGWLQKVDRGGPAGVDCDDNVPDPSWFAKPPAPQCSSLPDGGVSTSLPRATSKGEDAGNSMPEEPTKPKMMDTTKPKPSSTVKPEAEMEAKPTASSASGGGGCGVARATSSSSGVGLGACGLWLLGLALRRRRRSTTLA